MMRIQQKEEQNQLLGTAGNVATASTSLHPPPRRRQHRCWRDWDSCAAAPEPDQERAKLLHRKKSKMIVRFV
ncbi:MAG: hypothetical protein ACK5NE_07895 [Brachymonas sp.]